MSEGSVVATRREGTHLAELPRDQGRFARFAILNLDAVRDETDDGVTGEFFQFPLDRDSDCLTRFDPVIVSFRDRVLADLRRRRL